ncbi:hypothetical protein [Vibrio caribbeanicus]|uniref:hypothetical protein n=1 Tax=Vibrio caribbeanicus TaxID=701175 RepID=UPI000AC4DD12|nr:hypothetical protein [Vibrio caribbeanicus]
MKMKLALLSVAILAGCNNGGGNSKPTKHNAKKSVFQSVCSEQLDPGEQALTFTVNGTTADLSGTICSGSPQAFAEMMNTHKNVSLLNFVKIEGSINDNANLILARQVRAKNLDSVIKSSGHIASGGTDLFVAGVKRTIVHGAKIGVHSWSNGDKQATDYPKDSLVHQPYIDYYKDMGLPKPSEFYFFTIEQAPADGMYYMSEGELELYGLGKYNKDPETALTDNIDKIMLSQISKATQILKSENVWFDYGNYYANTPLYMLKDDGKGNSQKAYLIRPTKIGDDYQKLGHNENFGLDVYRYDTNMHLAADKLKPENDGNTAYEFDYEFEGVKYYLQRYIDSEFIHDGETKPYSIALNVHEMFHHYQSKNVKYPDWYKQDINNYPLDAKQIELKLITQKIFSGLPDKSLSKEALRKKLRQYVALTHKQMELDSTGLVRNMGLGQELFEGGAKYVEVTTVNHLGDFDQTFVYDGFDKIEFADHDQVKWQYAWGVFYDTGASVFWILNELGYDMSKLSTGTAPYYAAEALLGSFDKQAVLDDIYANENVSGFAALANKLANLPKKEKRSARHNEHDTFSTREAMMSLHHH